MKATNFVSVSPGTFVMGSPQNELGRENGEVQTKVGFTRGFMIGKYPVTQDEYAEVTGKNPSKHVGPSNPVDYVTWLEAVEFCRLATVKDRAAKLITSKEAYRLPTEAEWEYCCRAGTDTRFSFGDDEDHEEFVEYAWIGEDPEKGSSHPVGEKLPNDWGLFDMHGNVLEWCSDFVGPLKGGKEIVKDPQGPTGASLAHVVRGGSWFGMPRFARSAWRGGSEHPDHKCGFRVVLAPV